MMMLKKRTAQEPDLEFENRIIELGEHLTDVEKRVIAVLMACMVELHKQPWNVKARHTYRQIKRMVKKGVTDRDRLNYLVYILSVRLGLPGLNLA